MTTPTTPAKRRWGTADDTAATEAKIHDESPADGDLILVGSDGVGVRFHSFDLKSHSTVLRLMLDTTITETTIAFDDVNADALLLLSRTMQGVRIPVIPSKLHRELHTILAFCDKYALDRLVAPILHGFAETFGNDSGELINLYFECAKRRELLLIALISHHFASNVDMDSAAELVASNIDYDIIDELSPSWVHAMHLAERECVRKYPKTAMEAGSMTNAQWSCYTTGLLYHLRSIERY